MKKTEQLAEALRTKGGFEVFCHACYRTDLNDWHPNELAETDVYVRARHNMREPADYLEYYAYSPIHDAVCNALGVTAGTHEGDFGVLLHGMLPKKELRTIEQPDSVERVKKRGLAGFLGRTELITVHQEPRSTTVYESPQQLSSIVCTDKEEPAHFMQMAIGARIVDNDNRGRTYPTITVVAPRILVEDTVEYITKNPVAYSSLIRGLVPASEFPNVNKGIISKTTPFGRIYVIDDENAYGIRKERVHHMTESGYKESLFSKFGKKIDIAG